MNRRFHNKQQSLTVTDKQAGLRKLFDWSKSFIGHMFNIKLEKKSYNMTFKALPVKIQWSKHGHGQIGLTSKYGYKAPESACIPTFLVISIKKWPKSIIFIYSLKSCSLTSPPPLHWHVYIKMDLIRYRKLKKINN